MSSAAQKFKRRTNVNFPQFKTIGVQSLFGICITAPTRGLLAAVGSQLSQGQPRSQQGPDGARPGWHPGLCLLHPRSLLLSGPALWGASRRKRNFRGPTPLQHSPVMHQEPPHRVTEEHKSLHHPHLRCPQPGALAAPSTAAHTAEYRTELGVPQMPLHFQFKWKRNASRQTPS